MSWYRLSFMFLLLWVSSLLAQVSLVPREVNNEVATRQIRLDAAPGQTTYTMHVAARGKVGVIEVSDDNSGVLIQTLTCPLAMSPNPTDLEIKTSGEQFVAGFVAEDLDFNGSTDLRAPRDFAAKWQRDCVWLYDSHSHLFMKDLLAEQMELLYSFSVDRKRSRIISNSIGPYDPMWDEYRIETVGAGRPYWPRLIPVQSCFIEERPGNGKLTAVITRYEKATPVVVRRSISSEMTLPSTDMPEICKRP